MPGSLVPTSSAVTRAVASAAAAPSCALFASSAAASITVLDAWLLARRTSEAVIVFLPIEPGGVAEAELPEQSLRYFRVRKSSAASLSKTARRVTTMIEVRMAPSVVKGQLINRELPTILADLASRIESEA
jgi:hypothetical protein